MAVETLQQQQQLVDGYIEYVYQGDKVFIVMKKATYVAWTQPKGIRDERATACW